MREIKFRAWVGNPKSMRTVCELVDASNYFQLSTGYILGNVMQFTGLLDKNGKEIYEGDIVEFYREQHRQVRQMVWDDYLLCWEFKDRGYVGNLYEEEINSIEVIGNIHENPELLRVKK